LLFSCCFFFFFQAEDGIRDFHVTGVQTCALPILSILARGRGFLCGATAGRTTLNGEGLQHEDGHSQMLATAVPNIRAYDPAFARSEERRVGKEWRYRWTPDH